MEYFIAGVSVKFLMVGETNSMVGYHLMVEGHSTQLGVWGGAVSPSPPSPSPQQVRPGGGYNFLKIFLNIGLKRMFEKLKIDTF